MNAQVRFDNGAAYEKYMGVWSQLAAATFLDWLAPAPGLRWLDVGCGNGAFTEFVVGRCAPASVHGVDPSDAQLTFARLRPGLKAATFLAGDAMALPFAAASFDVAVMPLVLYFVPDPARGVAEMARVTAAGGLVAAYSWDMPGGGFPYTMLQAELATLGASIPMAPSPDASSQDATVQLWRAAGLDHVETRDITVQRTFRDFEDYWETVLGGPSVAAPIASLGSDNVALLRQRLRARLPSAGDGTITYSARANAVKGVVPD
jgi:SAM-dependent methyltransferase